MKFNMEHNKNFNVHKVAAFAKTILHTLSTVIFENVELSWTICLTESDSYGRWSLRHSHQDMYKIDMAGQVTRFHGTEDEPSRDTRALSSTVAILNQVFAFVDSELSRQQETQRWQKYQKIYAICQSLRVVFFSAPSSELMDLTYDVNLTWTETGRPFSRQANVCPVIRAARKALANQDSSALTGLLTDMTKVWSDYVGSLNRGLELLHNDTLSPELMEKMPIANVGKGATVAWPKIPAEPKLDGRDSIVEDFVFEKFNIDGQDFRRLITPNIVSTSRSYALH